VRHGEGRQHQERYTPPPFILPLVLLLLLLRGAQGPEFGWQPVIKTRRVRKERKKRGGNLEQVVVMIHALLPFLPEVRQATCASFAVFISVRLCVLRLAT
jgi:hypothetical protein